MPDRPPLPERRIRRRSSRRGSVLVVALLVAAMIALMLGGYLSVNLGASRLSMRTFSRGAAFHLAEGGLEEGLWTYNRILAAQPDPWEGWQVSGDSAWRRFENFELSPSITGAVKVYASPIAPTENAEPTVVALATVGPQGSPPVTQMLEVTLRRRSLFTAGLVARESLAVRGNKNHFDAWNSDPDRDPATPRVPYSEAVRRDTIPVATGADLPAKLGLGQARIYGTLTTRTEPSLSTTGLVGSFETNPGDIDRSRLAFDYNDNFPVLTAPTGGTLINPIGPTLGTLGTDSSWTSPSLRLSGNDTLTILGRVTLVLTDPVESLVIRGSATLVIPQGSSLTIYASGDLSIGGRGIINGNVFPEALQIWSTATAARPPSISLTGRASLTATLYAPEAHVTINGTPEFYGSLVAYTIVFAGNASFHYDEALGRLTRHAPFGATGWSPISAERAAELLPLVDR